MVKVGRHLPPAPDDLAALLERFTTAYGNDKLPRSTHHWSGSFTPSPAVDSPVRGRQWPASTRLYSHAFLKELGIGSSLWSVSRGLARAVDKYKAALQAADEPRRGDLDVVAATSPNPA